MLGACSASGGSQQGNGDLSPPHNLTAPCHHCCHCPPACLQGVTEEVRLIKWPSPAKAALNTVLVIGIVAGTAGLLLAITGALTELSTVLY